MGVAPPVILAVTLPVRPGVALLEGDPFVVTCVRAGAVQGTGKLYWASASSYAGATVVECAIVAWADAEITATMPALGAVGSAGFIIVINDDGFASTGKAAVAWPRIITKRTMENAGAGLPNPLTSGTPGTIVYGDFDGDDRCCLTGLADGDKAYGEIGTFSLSETYLRTKFYISTTFNVTHATEFTFLFSAPGNDYKPWLKFKNTSGVISITALLAMGHSASITPIAAERWYALEDYWKKGTGANEKGTLWLDLVEGTIAQVAATLTGTGTAVNTRHRIGIAHTDLLLDDGNSVIYYLDDLEMWGV